MTPPNPAPSTHGDLGEARKPECGLLPTHPFGFAMDTTLIFSRLQRLGQHYRREPAAAVTFHGSCGNLTPALKRAATVSVSNAHSLLTVTGARGLSFEDRPETTGVGPRALVLTGTTTRANRNAVVFRTQGQHGNLHTSSNPASPSAAPCH